METRSDVLGLDAANLPKLCEFGSFPRRLAACRRYCQISTSCCLLFSRAAWQQRHETFFCFSFPSSRVTRILTTCHDMTLHTTPHDTRSVRRGCAQQRRLPGACSSRRDTGETLLLRLEMFTRAYVNGSIGRKSRPKRHGVHRREVIPCPFLRMVIELQVLTHATIEVHKGVKKKEITTPHL